MATIMRQNEEKHPPLKTAKTLNLTLSATERHKRLLPYMTFYLAHDFNRPHQNLGAYQLPPPPPQKQQQSTTYQQFHNKFSELITRPKQLKVTPFLESNALPGGFVPLPAPQQPNQFKFVQPQKLPPNYSAIYDKLSQLKLQQQQQQYNVQLLPQNNIQYVRKQQQQQQPQHVTYIPVREYPVENNYETNNYEQVQVPVKTLDEHLHGINEDYNNQIYKEYVPQAQVPPKKPIANYRPVVFLQQKPPVYIVRQRQPQKRPIYYNKVVENYESPKYIQTVEPPKYVYPTVTTKYVHTPEPPQPTFPTEPEIDYKPPLEPVVDNSLSTLLKKLQDMNALPHTLTADNIDNSIRTLVKILSALKKQPKLQSKPIVVEDADEYEDELDNEAGVNLGENPGKIPQGVITSSQAYPENTPEGGTPGRPGVDYPALSTIPTTSFNCKTQRYKGFFGDPETNCQVWHYCDLNGGQASFLCPNGTIFSQVALTCDWWYNVKCSNTPQLYVLNERLYKYILPLSPKFPEDYSGPLVDKYLALKFKEMEEKMKEERRKSKQEQTEDVEEFTTSSEDIDDPSASTSASTEVQDKSVENEHPKYDENFR